MQLLLDPRFFNYVIMALFMVSAVRWAFAGSWVDASYWLFSLALTATVTFGYDR